MKKKIPHKKAAKKKDPKKKSGANPFGKKHKLRGRSKKQEDLDDFMDQQTNDLIDEIGWGGMAELS